MKPGKQEMQKAGSRISRISGQDMDRSGKEKVGIKKEEVGIKKEKVGIKKEKVGIKKEKIGIKKEKIGMQKKGTGSRKYGDWLGVLFLLAAVGMLVISVRLCFADGIWYDELYTMGLTRRSFGELTAFTARDVHPPFYYYYVKAVQGLCRMVSPQVNLTIISKLCSVLPLLGLTAYGVTRVRRQFGMLCAGLFVFCVTAMPNLPQYTVEIRMYTLAMFLVTAAFLHGYEIVCRAGIAGRESGSGKDWICLTLYGIMAAYTHYFACAAIGVLYLCLLVYFLWETVRDRAYVKRYAFWKPWLAAAAVSVLAYLPWMTAVVRQVAQVKESYWILPLTWRVFGSCVKFLMKPPFGSGSFQVAAAVVLFALYTGLFLYVVWKEKKRKNTEVCFLCLAGTGRWMFLAFDCRFRQQGSGRKENILSGFMPDTYHRYR